MTDRVQLFCLPYLGGNSTFYRGLKPYLKSGVLMTPIDPKGHGARIGEAPSVKLVDYLEDVWTEMQKVRQNAPISLLGYSMGASMAYALYFYLVKRNIHPVHLFLMANKPPYTADDSVVLSDLDDDAFVRMLVSYGGMPAEVAECRELMELFMPTLRADAILEEKTPWGDPQTVNCNMTVIYGKDDNPGNIMDQWKLCAGRLCDFYGIPGGHFFMEDHPAEVAEIINRHL